MIKVLTPANAVAITLDLLKEHLRIIGTDEDATLQLYLSAATEVFEAFANICLVNQTIIQIFDQFPCENYFLLERGAPLGSITHIKYYDEDNVLQTMPADDYIVCDKAVPPKICLATNANWPTDIHPTRFSAVEVTYTAGYGASEASVPKDIKLALASLVGDMYQNKEDSITMPGSVKIDVNWPSVRFIKKYKPHYYEHPSQGRPL